jgi:protein required for attachment to host cells
MMKLNRTWIVVADGAQARILLYTERVHGVRQLPNSDFHDAHAPTHELVTDQQPRVHESVGSARHAIEPRIDPHRQRKLQFLEKLTQHLSSAAQRGEFEHLVLVAPAPAMGQLRKDLGPQLKKMLFAEIVHDYAHQTNDYIFEHIKNELPF